MQNVTHFSGRQAVFLGAALGLSTLLGGCGNSEDAQPATPKSVREAGGTRIGEVSSATKIIGSDHKIVVDSYPDPKVQGIVIYVSKSQAGGLSGDLGLANELNEASVAARQVGPIKVLQPFGHEEDVIDEDRDILFKNLKISRMWDDKNDTFVYLVYSRGAVDGSPKNTISAVVARDWEGQEPDLSVLENN